MANTQKHVRKLNDTLLPLNVLVELNGQPVDLSAYTVTFRIEEDGGTVIQAGGSVTSHPTQTFTASGTTTLATCNGHGLSLDGGQQVIVANSGGALPSGLAASTRYWTVNVTPNAFGLATLPGGTSVIAGAGTGTHTFYIVGSLQYDFAAGDVDAAGLFRAWVIFTSSTETHHFPADGHIPIEIQGVGN
jgi:hypothetical protein